MGLESDIKSLFENVLKKHNGNKKKAAESLGVNPVTFFHWVKGARGLNNVLCTAIDKTGAKLSFFDSSPHINSEELKKILDENEKLKAEIVIKNAIIETLQHTLNPKIKANQLKTNLQSLKLAKRPN